MATDTSELCTFCQIIETGEANWVVDQGTSVAFLCRPEGALAPGHTLVLPRKHAQDFLSTSESLLCSTMMLVRRVGDAMIHSLGATGFNVLCAIGADAGQSINHLHFHVVPCWADDKVTFWPETTSHHLDLRPTHRLMSDFLSEKPEEFS